MKDITLITGASRDNLEGWMEKGFIIPSIRRASGQGTRNIFSIEDLYRIATFKKLISSGWYRQTASDLIISIDTKDIDMLISIGFLLKLPHVKLKTSEKIALEIKKASKTKITLPELQKITRAGFRNAGLEVGLYLVFLRKDNETSKRVWCVPFPVDYSESGKGLFDIGYKFKDLIKSFNLADDIFILNFGRIIDEINDKLILKNPELFLNQYKKITERIDKAPDILPLSQLFKLVISTNQDLKEGFK